MKPPRMRISVLGGDAAFEHELGVVGHQVVRSFRDIDMFLIAETIPKNVVKAAETLPSVRGKVIAHMCPTLPPLTLPGAVSLVLARIHPALDALFVIGQDEVAEVVGELLCREVGYELVDAEYRKQIAEIYNTLIHVEDLP